MKLISILVTYLDHEKYQLITGAILIAFDKLVNHAGKPRDS